MGSSTLGQECGVVFGTNSKLIVEAMMPDVSHLVPILDHAMLERVV